MLRSHVEDASASPQTAQLLGSCRGTGQPKIDVDGDLLQDDAWTSWSHGPCYAVKTSSKLYFYKL